MMKMNLWSHKFRFVWFSVLWENPMKNCELLLWRNASMIAKRSREFNFKKLLLLESLKKNLSHGKLEIWEISNVFYFSQFLTGKEQWAIDCCTETFDETQSRRCYNPWKPWKKSKCSHSQKKRTRTCKAQTVTHWTSKGFKYFKQCKAFKHSEKCNTFTSNCFLVESLSMVFWFSQVRKETHFEKHSFPHFEKISPHLIIQFRLFFVRYLQDGEGLNHHRLVLMVSHGARRIKALQNPLQDLQVLIVE